MTGERETMGRLKPLPMLAASLAVAAALLGLVSLWPDNPYLRWQTVDGTLFEPLRVGYERIHFDPRPVDVAIIGPSRTALGLSADRIAEQLAAKGLHLNVANLSVAAAGRNVQWAVAEELFKAKPPKVLVLDVEEQASHYGHPAFKFVAPASAIAFQPQPLLHNYFYDLVYLPSRQFKLMLAEWFPSLAGARKEFDAKRYAEARTDFSSGVFFGDGKWIDMDRAAPAEELLKQKGRFVPRNSIVENILSKYANDGDEIVYLREIIKLAKAHGTKIIFAYMPIYDYPLPVFNKDYLARNGVIVDNADLCSNSKLFQSASHFNHAGAMIASDRAAQAIAASLADNGRAASTVVR